MHEMTKRRPRVMVLFGGRSGEHAISCSTASGVLAALDRTRYDVVAVGITKAGRWVLVDTNPEVWAIGPDRDPHVPDSPQQVVVAPGGGASALQVVIPGEQPRDLGVIDVVFPLLHGPFGEDGTVQGLLEMADLRYVGPGVLASAAGMDKHIMKVVLEGHGLPVGPYQVVHPRADNVQELVPGLVGLGLPLFVKPARAGSSLGITKVDDLAQLPAALLEAARHDPKVVVEAAIAGREIECGVLGGRGEISPRASVPGEIVMSGAGHTFYDYEAKYFDHQAARTVCPAPLPPEVTARVQKIAVETFMALGCEGLSRVDMFVTADNQVIVNEINTMPGFTPYSMYPVMWQESGMPYGELVDELIQLALARPVGLR